LSTRRSGSGNIVIDDHLLLRILLDDEPADLRPDGATIFTTGLWYHRLCRALTNTTVSGVLSGALGSADPALGARAVQAITDLPEAIRLTSLRELAWPMAALLADGVRLNLMSLEALAAAEYLGADICLAAADDNPQLVGATAGRAVSVHLISS
jgi:hypothetical protein